MMEILTDGDIDCSKLRMMEILTATYDGDIDCSKLRMMEILTVQNYDGGMYLQHSFEQSNFSCSV